MMMKMRMTIAILPLLQVRPKKETLNSYAQIPDIWVQRGKDLIPCAGAISQKYQVYWRK